MSTTIESLELEILSSSQSAESGLDKLTASLEKLKTATKGGVGLTAVANQLQKVSSAVNSISPNAVSNVTGLAKAIELLGGTKVSSTIAKQITAMSTALNGADFTSSGAKITELVTALKPLETLGKSSLGTTVKALNKLPEALSKLDTRQLYTQIQSLTRIFKPLADEMQKVANGFSAFPTKIQKLISTTNSLSSANNKASKSYIDLWAKLKMGITSIKGIASAFAPAVQSAMDYHETVNLFSVAMGKYAEEAATYANNVSDLMGIDPAEWMKYQGTIMTLATGFGIAGDRANIMSQQLTQLAYDISSFRDISVETAMQKIQSGFAGELEPLRAIGYDLSQAKLEAIATSLGIDKAVSSMTQAEKAQLRYYAIMTQVTEAQQDMGKTLESPTNQMRIFKAQITQTGRAIGNLVIPLLNQILPYLIAITKVVRILVDMIAGLFNIELPEVEFSGVDNLASGADDATEGLENATDAAKKLKSYTLGFDELNVLSPDDSGNSGDDGSSDQFNFDLPTYDFLGKATESRVNEIVEDMKEWLGLTGEIDSWADLLDTKFGDILIAVGLIGGAIGAWKIAKATANALETIGKIKDKFNLGKTPKAIEDVAKDAGSVGDKTSTLTSKLTTLVKNLALGLVVIAEVAAAAILIVGAIWVLGKELEQVGIAWQPVLDNGETIAIAVGIGTALLVGIGAATAGLGSIGTTLIVNIALGTAILAEVGVAAALFLAEILVVGKLLDEIGKAWQPVLDNGETIATAIGIGTGILLAVGVVAAALGALTMATGGTVALALAAGTGMLVLIGADAALFLAEILNVGKLLEDIGIAWKPVLDNGEDIEKAIDKGTDLLIAIGVVSVALGGAAIASVGLLPLAIAAGTGMLKQLADAFGDFCDNLSDVADDIADTLAPALEKVNGVLPSVKDNMGDFVSFMTEFAGDMVIYAGSSAIAGIAATIDKFIKFFTTDPVEHLADEIDGQHDDLVRLKDDFKGMKTMLPEVQDGMDDYVDFMTSFAGDMVVYTLSSAIAGIAATINKFLGFFTTDPMKRMADEVNEQYGYAKTLKANLKKAIPEIRDATDMLEDYDDAIGDFEEASGTSFGANSVKNFLVNLTVSVIDKATSVWSNIKTTFGNVGSWFETNVASPVKKKFSDMWENAPTKAGEAWSGIKRTFDSVGKWFETNVGTPIGNSLKNGWKKVTDAFSNGGDIFTDIKDGVLSGFKNVVNKLIGGINKVIKVPFDGINAALDKIRNISIFGSKPFDGIGSISVPQIPTLADGGIVNSGQLFIAREAGPELVSNIGGRTAVMNNDQIVESVSAGVYQAVVAALGSGSDEGGETQIVINLDGEKIYENQQKVARNRGYNLGMGAFSFG